MSLAELNDKIAALRLEKNKLDDESCRMEGNLKRNEESIVGLRSRLEHLKMDVIYKKKKIDHMKQAIVLMKAFEQEDGGYSAKLLNMQQEFLLFVKGKKDALTQVRGQLPPKPATKDVSTDVGSLLNIYTEKLLYKSENYKDFINRAITKCEDRIYEEERDSGKGNRKRKNGDEKSPQEKKRR